ncbi:tetratricopeptide repeat-containing sulfotransferase family protein [Lysobacter tyrosinilyticus]
MTTAAASWFQAQQALAAGNMAVARQWLEATLAADPHHAQAHVMLAGVALSQQRLRDASAQLLEAARRPPADAAQLQRLVQALLRVGEVVAAKQCLASPVIARCSEGRVLAQIAHLHQQIGDHATALALMDRARDAGFDNPDFRYFRSIQLQFNGRLDEAREELETCLRMGPTFGRASLTLARLRKQTPDSNHLAFIRAQLTRVASGSEDHAAFEFAQYKELEDLGDFDGAWNALQRANAIMFRRQRYDAQARKRDTDMLIARFQGEFAKPADVAHPGPTPIFIVGLPRSGTTLLDRILGNHSQVTSAGELGDFAQQLQWAADHPARQLLDESLLQRLPDVDFAEIGRRYLAQTQWRAAGRAYYIDKLPPNHQLAGLIAKALPHAPILHMVRDPMDVCFSNYRALFGDSYPYSYDLGALANHYREYQRLSAHWHRTIPGRIVDVSYAELVRDTEKVARSVLAACGLAWEADLTDLSRNDAPVATLSSAQVRESVHARSIGEWRRYERQLAPLAEMLQV